MIRATPSQMRWHAERYETPDDVLCEFCEDSGQRIDGLGVCDCPSGERLASELQEKEETT